MEILNGIDISRWQGRINFNAVRDAGIQFVLIKATEGGTFVDPCFIANWQGAQDAGLYIGAYHYFRASSSTPIEQRDNIITALSQVGFDPALHRLAIDIETARNTTATPTQMADNAFELLKLLEESEDISGITPLVYGDHATWRSHLDSQRHDFGRYPLWIAQWEVETPSLPDSWFSAGKTWSVWQYSSKGRVAGIEGAVDLDRARASLWEERIASHFIK